MYEVQTGVAVLRSLALVLLLAAIALLLRQEALLSGQRDSVLARAATEPIFLEELSEAGYAGI